ncbi:MAG: DeoR/GlpR family DNA-binding transcription regulator [Tissierellales bacterium]|jgi:DeoR/GlpR family transcriptional regulator of sugar metabolism|nr:DeoR/GlpR family DNA-binding transcription regulator [Tissierellales bacterium]
MCREKRFEIILEYLREHKQINIETICKICEVSRDTARRDLVSLEEKKLIHRTRGGAMLPKPNHFVKTYRDRLLEVSEEKKDIGRLAANLINDGDTLILDTSTTVQFCAENISARGCNIITNSINQADILSNNPDLSIYLLGGRLNSDHKYLYGQTTIDMLNNYTADICFIGVCGISPRGLSIAHEDDGHVMKKMIERSNQVILLCDHTKFNKKEFFSFASLNQIDILVTDQMPTGKLLEALKNNDIKILIA